MKFEPVCYDHAALLTGRTPSEMSRDPSLLASAHLKALETYGYDAVIVGVDIYNVEPEAYGCRLDVSEKDAMPSVHEPVFSNLEDILKVNLDPEESGRIPMLFEAARLIRAKRRDIDIRIPMSGPFTIACHLFGLENMICEMMLNPETAGRVLDHLASNQIKYADRALKEGCNISLFESSAAPPLLSPDMFRDHVAPPIDRIFKSVRTKTNDIQLIIGGNTAPILDSMISLKPSYIICPFETNQKEFMEKVPADYLKAGNVARVNMNPKVFTMDKVSAISEAKRVLDIASKYPNTTIGSLIPYNAKKEIVLAVSAYLQ